MKTSLIRLSWIAFALTGSVALQAAAASLPDPAMAGRWTGTAEIVVNWTAQRALPVELTIATDGSVSGKVGDAQLVLARLTSNRSWLGRALHLKTDYIVTGELRGEVIAAEGIRREGRVTLPLNWIESHFRGGLHTSGEKFGGKETMILSATHLRLKKEAAPP